MKFFDKLALKIFSAIALVVAIMIILILVGILPAEIFVDSIIKITDSTDNILQIVLAVLAVIMLLAIKGLFFTSKSEDTGKDGIILENTSGKLVISKESLENLIASVIKDVPGAETVSSRTILDKNRNLIIYVTAIVSKDVMLKDISNELQLKIKEMMKKTADLEVKEVNIKIKNITSKKVKGLPAPIEESSEEHIEENREDKIEENVEE